MAPSQPEEEVEPEVALAEGEGERPSEEEDVEEGASLSDEEDSFASVRISSASIGAGSLSLCFFDDFSFLEFAEGPSPTSFPSKETLFVSVLDFLSSKVDALLLCEELSDLADFDFTPPVAFFVELPLVELLSLSKSP